MGEGQVIPGDEGEGRLTFRFAQKQDAGLIHGMIGALAAFLSDEDKHIASIDDYEHYGFGDAPQFECILAEYGSEPVGMCLFFSIFSSWMGKPGLYVQDLYVCPSARKTGLGKKLLAHVARLGQERGCGYLRLSVDVDNNSAQSFYERCGLCFSPSEKMYMATGEAFFALSDLDGCE